MSARIAPDSVAAIVPVSDYRPPAPAVAQAVPTVAGTSVQTNRNPYVEAAKVSGAVSGAVEGAVESRSPVREEQAPAPLPVEKPGADYVRAVISGALAPRPTSAQELFARVGTSWTPPESEYRLTEKIA